GLDQQRWHADSIQKVLAGLRLVVMIRAAESERRRGDSIVDLVECAGCLQIVPRVAPCREEALAHAFQEAALVKTVIELAQPSNTGSEIERSRDSADAIDEVCLPKFARQFQRDIRAQRIAHEKDRPGMRQGFEKHAQVGGQAGMIKGLAEMRGISARPHVKAVDDETRMERVPRHADDVARIAAAFKTVDQHDLTDRLDLRILRLHSYLRIRV